MAMAATPATLVDGPNVGLRLLTLQPTTAIVRSLDLRPAILPVPTLERATNVVGRLILEEGASGQARPHEVVEGAKGIPRPAMARRMATETDRVGSRPPATSPTVAGASPDTVGGPARARIAAPEAAVPAGEARHPLEAKASARTMPAVPALAAPATSPATSGLAPRVRLRRATVPVAAVPGEARLDGLGPATDTLHDAVQVPQAG